MTFSDPPRAASIISPAVDFLCVGGFSLIILIPLLLSGREQLDLAGLGMLVWLQALINYFHFMASYRLVYRDRQTIRRHRWAAIWVPLILVAGIVIAVVTATDTRFPLTVFVGVASGYLAWHYTGQVWGMMASHAYLSGLRFDGLERLLLRTSLRILLVWHVSWFLHTALRDPTIVEPLYRLVSSAAAVAFGLGAVGLVKIWLRTGAPPPYRAVVAWLALFAWYAALARWGVPALFLVQLFHAIQYLEFPVRVELNRAARDRAGRVAGQLLAYTGFLLVLSALIFLIVPGPAMSIIATMLGAPTTAVAPLLVWYSINIHHYFTDGVIWKLSNPEVRRELFAHVTPEQPAPPVASEPATPGVRKKPKKGVR